MVNRYVVTGDPMESPYGHWVAYSDYEALAKRLKELEERIVDLNDFIYEIQERM